MTQDLRIGFALYCMGALLTCAWTAHARRSDRDLQEIWRTQRPWFGDAGLWAALALVWPVMLWDLIEHRVVRRWPRRGR